MHRSETDAVRARNFKNYPSRNYVEARTVTFSSRLFPTSGLVGHHPQRRIIGMSTETPAGFEAGKLLIIPFHGSYIFKENPQCKHLDEKSL